MPRRKFNDGMEVVYQDFDALSAAIEREFYDRTLYEIVQRTTDAFFGDSFLVSYVGPTTVSVAAGSGIQYDSGAVSPEPNRKALFRPSATNLNLNSPDPTDPRIDIVVCKYNTTNELTDTRNFKDAGDNSISAQSFTVQVDKLADLLVVAGTPAGSPVAPATPSGYLKIATLAVAAITGLSGSGDVTDNRSLMPVGSSTSINTLGYARLTAGAAIPLNTLFAEIDALLEHGYFEYFDLDELAVAPASPGASKRRLYIKDGILFQKDSGGSAVPIGSGGGGGAGAKWFPKPGSAPLYDETYGFEAYRFAPGNNAEQMVLWVKVPDSYISGRPITMTVGAFSPSSSGTQLLKSVTTLVEKNSDAIDSAVDTHTSPNTALTNTVAKQYREHSCELSSSTGGINSVAVAAGDLLKIELARYTDTDTDDVYFVPSLTEIKFN